MPLHAAVGINCNRKGRERELASRADRRVLRWFVHVGRKDKYRMARKVLTAGIEVDRG